MKLIIVRHGQTYANVAGILQGQSEGMLNEFGKKQAIKVALRLKDDKIDVAYVSDLQRAKDTSKPILKFHDETEVIFSKQIRERRYGSLEGKNLGQRQKIEKELNVNYDDFDFKYPGGESRNEFIQRAKYFYLSLLKKHFNQIILLVSHGAFIATLMLEIMGKKYS